MKKKLKPLEWLSNEVIKDELILKTEKESLINEIKKYKKEDIVPPKIKKLSLWQKLLKVIMN